MKSYKQVLGGAFLTSLCISLLFTGCTSSKNIIPASQTEHPATQKLSAAVTQLEIAVSDLTQNKYQRIINQYEEHWQQMQGTNDMLKKTASLQPLDDGQISMINESLQALRQELAGIENVNQNFENELKSINKQVIEINKRAKLLDEAWLEYRTAQPKDAKFTEANVNAVKAEAVTAVQLAEKTIGEINQIAKMYNGKAQGLYHATEKYVSTFKKAN